MVDPISAGSRLLDEDLAAWRTGINAKLDGGVKIKPADTVRASSGSLTIDPHLAGIPVLASTSYTVDFYFRYTSGTTPDFSYDISAPAGTTFNSFMFDYNPGTRTEADCGPNGGVTGLVGTGAIVRCVVRGSILIGGTAGTVGVRWSQAVSTASNTTLHAGSRLVVIKAS